MPGLIVNRYTGSWWSPSPPPAWTGGGRIAAALVEEVNADCILERSEAGPAAWRDSRTGAGLFSGTSRRGRLKSANEACATGWTS